MQMFSSFGSGVDKQRSFDCSLSTESKRPQSELYVFLLQRDMHKTDGFIKVYIR